MADCSGAALCVVMGLFASLGSAAGARVLVMHHFGASHFRDSQILAVELIKNGHQASILTSSKYVLLEDSTLHTLRYDGSRFSDDLFKSFVWEWTHTGRFEMSHLLKLFSLDCDVCEIILADQVLVEELRSYDLILGEYISWCPLFVAELINKPVITYHVNTMTGAGRFLGMPLPLSYVPVQGFGFSDRMDFLGRFRNAFVRIFQEIMNEFIARSMFDPLVSKYNVSASKSAVDIMKQSELSLVFMDFLFDYPHPLLPHVVFVGPLLYPQLGLLPVELEDFISGAGDYGIVVVSFGSIIEELDSKVLIKMATAFKELKQRVIWKIKVPTYIQLAGNVKAMDWIPQPELLAHPKAKAFVTHCGVRSLYEAIYNAVPVLAVPLVADGFDNAQRIVGRLQMGRRVAFLTATADDWKQALEDVLDNSSYKENALKASAVLKARKSSGLKSAMEWINYTVACGGRLPHLHVAGLSMPWFILNSVDVLLAAAALLLLLIFIFRLVCKCFCWCFCCKRSRTHRPVNVTKKKL